MPNLIADPDPYRPVTGFLGLPKLACRPLRTYRFTYLLTPEIGSPFADARRNPTGRGAVYEPPRDM